MASRASTCDWNGGNVSPAGRPLHGRAHAHFRAHARGDYGRACNAPRRDDRAWSRADRLRHHADLRGDLALQDLLVSQAGVCAAQDRRFDGPRCPALAGGAVAEARPATRGDRRATRTRLPCSMSRRSMVAFSRRWTSARRRRVREQHAPHCDFYYDLSEQRLLDLQLLIDLQLLRRPSSLRVNTMRKPGLEPGRVSPLDPKSSASTNSATSAIRALVSP